MDIMYVIGTNGCGTVYVGQPNDDGDGYLILAERFVGGEDEEEFADACREMLAEVSRPGP